MHSLCMYPVISENFSLTQLSGMPGMVMSDTDTPTSACSSARLSMSSQKVGERASSPVAAVAMPESPREPCCWTTMKLSMPIFELRNCGHSSRLIHRRLMSCHSHSSSTIGSQLTRIIEPTGMAAMVQ